MNIWDEKFYGGIEHLRNEYQVPEKHFGDFLQLLSNIKAKRVLDLGCGTGRHTIALAKEGFEVFGIDISRNALKVCRDRLKEQNLKADLKLADIYKKLPYEDNFFDGLISTHTMHHAVVKDIKNLIREIERVLKPGAIIMIISPQKSDDDTKRKDIKIIEPNTVIHLTGTEKGIPHHRFDKNELRQLFHNFQIIKFFVKKEKYYSRPHFVMLAKLNK